MLPRPKTSPLGLAITYVIAAAAWIVGTDWISDHVVSSTPMLIPFQTAKGFLFVGFTGLLLYTWARRMQSATETQRRALSDARQRSEQVRRMYATLSAVNRHVIRPVDPPQLQQAICNALIDPGEFTFAWIGRIGPSRNVVYPLIFAGIDPGAEVGLDPQSGNRALATIARAAQSDLPKLCDRIDGESPGSSHWLHASNSRSCIALPLHPERLDPLLLVVGGAKPDSFESETVTMLRELVADLEHGLEVIAERERHGAAAAALRASEQRYRLVAENSQDVIWILSLDWKPQYISPSVQRLLGYTPAEMMRLDFAQFFTAASHRRVLDELTQMTAARREKRRMPSRLLELEQLRVDGTTVWTEIHTTEFHDEQGHTIGILGVTRDITERRAAAQALANEIARCRALLDVSVDAIHVMDPIGRLIDANDIFLRERGFTREMVPSLQIANWDIEFSQAEIEHRLSTITAEPTMFETMHRRANGGTFAVEVWAKRVQIAGREVIYCTARDITDRKSLEQRLLRAQRLESVGLIASGIAHDLNNVLTPILLSTELLRMRYKETDDCILLEPIESAARRGSNIVQQILTFARGAEGQRMAIEPKILLKELSSLVRETFPRNISHRLNIAPDAHAVTGDPTQLHQVFLNLAVNARDAMPEGGTLTIDVRNRTVAAEELRAQPSAKPGDYVCFSIVDTGTGMTADVLDHIFEPFYTTKPRGRGTGLGLSTVHGLVRGHGGFVEVYSTLGRGSEFRVFLPMAPTATPAATTVIATTSQRKGRGEHILVADDEPAILTVAESVLRRHGFTALTAADGNEAMVLLEQHGDRIAVVVTDVMMPNLDGVRLAAEVRRRYPTLPIIAMSGLIAPAPGDHSRQQLKSLGVTSVIDKPYGEAELLGAIEHALDGRVPRSAK